MNRPPATYKNFDKAREAAEDIDCKYKNIGSDIAAKKLREIAETGVHRGVFGGEEMEKAAQAILKLCKQNSLLDLRAFNYADNMLEEAAKIAETWGNAPPSPLGRRAALAAAIRGLKS